MRSSPRCGSGWRSCAAGLTLALVLMAVAWVPTGRAAPAPGTIERVSVSSAGEERNKVPTGSTTGCAGTTPGKCTKRAISADGSRIVFASRAPNLVDDDTNGASDIFLWDANAEPRVRRVSVPNPAAGGVGHEADGDSETPSISPNGDWIAFESLATNLVGDDNKMVGDVFVYQVSTNTLTLASVPDPGNGGSGGSANMASFSPSVANDGSVAFTSFASNLVDPRRVSQFQNVYLRRAPASATPATVIVSQGGGELNDPAQGPSLEPSISGDGLKVAFTSAAKNVAGSEAENDNDVFVATLGASGLSGMVRITETDRGTSFAPSISADGNRVAFVSEGFDNDGLKDIYVAPANQNRPSPTLMSHCNCPSSSAGSLDRPAVVPSMSDTGAVTFQSAARFLDDVRNDHIWVKGSGPVQRVSEGLDGPGDEVSEYASISADGNFVVFSSSSANLVPADGNRSSDVFRKSLADGSIIRVSVGPGGREASGFSSVPASVPALSADGGVVAFESDSSNLVPGDSNGVADIFVRDRAAGTTTRVSVGPGGAETDGPSRNPAISGDGRYVVFESTAGNLVEGDANGVADVFVHDRHTGETKLVSRSESGHQGMAASQNPSISPNGRWIAFESASALAFPPTTALAIYRYDMHSPTGSLTLASKSLSVQGQQARAPDRDSRSPSVADDGSVAYLSLARKLTDPPEDPATRNFEDVFVTRPGGEVVKASVGNGGETADGNSMDPVISADGTKVAFSSLATNLPVPHSDLNPDADVFLRDLSTNTTVRVSVGLNGGVPGGPSISPSLSGDGSLVAFISSADNLVPGDSNGVEDAFLASPGGEVRRVSVRPDGVQADGPSFTPSVSGHGLSLAFHSMATNLVDSDTNDAFDAFVRDLAPGDLPVPCEHPCAPVPARITGLGYRFVAADGGVFTFDQTFHGSMGGSPLNRPIVGIVTTPSNQGYWLVASDGGIFSFGDAGFFGSTGDIRLNSPIVGMTATPSGSGYWFVAADGGIFSFGDAVFEGSMGGKPLNRPIVGMAATRTGQGYWLVASDGGIFSFGDAAFFGSTGDLGLVSPIVGMDRSAIGNGYRFVAADGGVFTFGDARFFGSMGGESLKKPIVGMARSRVGDGYWLVSSDGGIFTFGDAPFFGSAGDLNPNSPIVGMAS